MNVVFCFQQVRVLYKLPKGQRNKLYHSFLLPHQLLSVSTNTRKSAEADSRGIPRHYLISNLLLILAFFIFDHTVRHCCVRFLFILHIFVVFFSCLSLILGRWPLLIRVMSTKDLVESSKASYWIAVQINEFQDCYTSY